MIRKPLFLFLFTLLTLQLIAQNERKSIFTMQKEYVAINFQVADSQKVAFWNIYNAFLQDEAEIHHQFREVCKSLNVRRGNDDFNMENLDNESIERYYIAYYDYKDKLLELNRQFFESFTKVLSPSQFIQFKKVLRDFKSDIKNKAKDACPKSE